MRKTNGPAREIHQRFVRTIGRFSMIAFPVLAVILVGLTGPLGTEEFFQFRSAFTVSAAAKDRTAPTAPSNLRVTGTTTSSVSLAWSASTDNSGSFSYKIRNSGGSEISVPQGYTSYTWASNLNAGQTYSFYVYAIDAARNTSGNSNAVSVTLPATTAPPSTPEVSVIDVGPTHISLAWSTTGGGRTLRYLVFKDGNLDRQATAETSRTFYLLEPQTTHTFTVQAKDGAYLSPQSNTVTVTTEPRNSNDTTPPTRPANLRAEYWGGNEMQLIWDQSVDDLDQQSIIRYDVYVNGVLENICVGSGRSHVYIIEGRLNTLTVVAVDTAGNRSAEATITFSAN